MLQPNLEKLDCLVRVVTPENVEFEYSLAGPFQRVLAFLFDFVVRIAAFFGVMLIMIFFSVFIPFAGTLSTIAMILFFFVLSWFYGVYFESMFNGRTLGKMVFKLRVISTDGRPINGMQAALRNLLRSADTFPSPITGLICMTATQSFQRIGDLAAGTMVITDRQRQPLWDLQPDDSRAFGLAELIPPSFIPSYSMTQTIGMYMENRRKLPMARRLEVAKHLARPLLTQFDLQSDTSYDLLLCALYVRIFMSEQQQATGRDLLRQARAANRSAAQQRPAYPSMTQPAYPTMARPGMPLPASSPSTAAPVAVPAIPSNSGNNDAVEIVASLIDSQTSKSMNAPTTGIDSGPNTKSPGDGTL